MNPEEFIKTTTFAIPKSNQATFYSLLDMIDFAKQYAQSQLKERDKRIERLNNKINHLDKYIKSIP